jgi:hypothetical protein
MIEAASEYAHKMLCDYNDDMALSEAVVCKVSFRDYYHRAFFVVSWPVL